MKKRNLKSLKLRKTSVSNLHSEKGGAIVSCSVIECIQSDTTITTIDPVWSVFCPKSTLCETNSIEGNCSLGHCPSSYWGNCV